MQFKDGLSLDREKKLSFLGFFFFFTIGQRSPTLWNRWGLCVSECIDAQFEYKACWSTGGHTSELGFSI